MICTQSRCHKAAMLKVLMTTNFLCCISQELAFEARLQAASGSMSGSHPISNSVSVAAGHHTDASGGRDGQIESELAAEQTFTARLMKAAWQPVLSGVTTGADGTARKRQRRAGDVDLDTQLRDEHIKEMLLLQAMSRQAPQ